MSPMRHLVESKLQFVAPIRPFTFTSYPDIDRYRKCGNGSPGPLLESCRNLPDPHFSLPVSIAPKSVPLVSESFVIPVGVVFALGQEPGFISNCEHSPHPRLPSFTFLI